MLKREHELFRQLKLLGTCIEWDQRRSLRNSLLGRFYGITAAAYMSKFESATSTFEWDDAHDKMILSLRSILLTSATPSFVGEGRSRQQPRPATIGSRPPLSPKREAAAAGNTPKGNSSGSSNGKMAKAVCDNCGKLGHYARFCLQLPVDSRAKAQRLQELARECAARLPQMHQNGLVTPPPLAGAGSSPFRSARRWGRWMDVINRRLSELGSCVCNVVSDQ